MMKIPRYFDRQDRLILLKKRSIEYQGDLAGIRLTNDGWRIKIANQKKWTEPMTLLCQGDKTASTLQISLAKNLHATIDLFFLVADKQGDIDLTIELATGATLELTNVFSGATTPTLVIRRQMTLMEAGRLTLYTGLIAEGSVMMTDHMVLSGTDAQYTADFLAIAGGNNHFDATQTILHQAPKTTSSVVNLLVAAGQSKMNFDVTGTIQKGNYQSSCHQQNRGIILESSGVIAVEPKLIIEEYDVDAGHGCAIGDINADELYYLQSRGMDETTAKRLIVSGYLSPLYHRIANPGYLRHLTKVIETTLKGANL